MEKVQKDVNASMRAILIDWLVEVIMPGDGETELAYLLVHNYQF